MRSRLLTLGLSVLSILSASATLAAQTTHQVDIYDFGYDPKVVFIQPGDSVRFTNTGGQWHTATNGNAVVGAFRASLNPGQSDVITFDATMLSTWPQLCNTYGYSCEPHPTMSGQIIIGSGGSIGIPYCSPFQNSTGVGASFCVNGSQSVGDNDLNFTVADLPLNQFGYFLMSRSPASIPGFGGSQGKLCVGSPFYRFSAYVLNSGTTGTFQFSPDLTNLPQGQVILAGENWFFQAWYRDNNPGSTSNTTGANVVTFM